MAFSTMKYQGTVRATPNYDGEADARAMREAMKGIGTNEELLSDTLARRTAAERVKMVQMYKTMFGKDMKDDLESELSGELETIVKALIMPQEEYDSHELHRAMKGLGTDEGALIEILGTRSNKQIETIKKLYKTHYKSDLEKDIKSETSGYFERLLVSLLAGGRREDQQPDAAKARTDAAALYKAGEQQMGTDEVQFNAILVSQSYDQLRLVFDEYDKLSKKTIEEAIGSEMSGDIKDGMLAVVQCARNRPAYFAEKLYKAMHGLGTDEKTVIRCVVTRCDVDMVQVKQEFEKLYGKSLEKFIEGDFSGDSQHILMALVRD